MNKQIIQVTVLIWSQHFHVLISLSDSSTCSMLFDESGGSSSYCKDANKNTVIITRECGWKIFYISNINIFCVEKRV